MSKKRQSFRHLNIYKLCLATLKQLKLITGDPVDLNGLEIRRHLLYFIKCCCSNCIACDIILKTGYFTSLIYGMVGMMFHINPCLLFITMSMP